MNDILDYNPSENTPKPSLFSKVAFGCTLIIITMLLADIIFPVIAPILIQDNVFPYVFYSFCSFSFLGFLFSILSYIKKEENNFYKTISLVLNILFFIFAIISIIVQNKA